MRKLLQILALCAFALAPLTAFAQTYRDVDALLEAWRMTEAKEALASYAAANPNAAEVLALEARVDFYEGRYAEAAQRLDQALTQSQRPDWAELRDLAVATRDVMAKHERHLSPKGYFAVYVEPGRDRVLLPWAFEALDVAYEAFAEELGYRPPTPIRVEVYAKTSTLATVSVLTEEEIKTSGTIALCKYNRLMITSPRALVRGYGWVDTLVHEYVHYVVNQRTGNQVPIWMHEGLAKFLERRWRGPDAHRLQPHSEHLLQQRVAANDLITFAQMHPSMAKLPSQEDAAVAFAEVYTAMEYLRERAGAEAFRRLLDEIANGEEAATAFAKVLGTTFEQFERDWQRALRSRPKIAYPEDTSYQEKLLFRGDADADEFAKIPQPQARDHINLGQMLQARGRAKAAVVEYRKAERLMGSGHPVLQTRLAQSLLEVGSPREAWDALLPIRDAHPSHVSTWIQLGRAAYELGQYDEARQHLDEAARINPFDPEVHARLALVYEKLGDAERARRAAEFEKLVK